MPLDLARTLDSGPWTRHQRWLVFLTATTIIFDGFDNQLLGIAIPSIMQEWLVARGRFAAIVSLGTFGMMIGGAAAGIVGDRFGRKTALLGSMLIFGASTLAISIAGSLTTLAALRLVAGIGLGGAIPNAASLAAEYVPLRQRPLAVTFAIVCVPLGGVIAGLVAVPALPAVGWRGLFAIGGAIPIAAALLLMRLLPESPRFLVRHPHRGRELTQVLRRMGLAVADGESFTDSTERGDAGAPIAALLSRTLRADTIALWTAFFSCLLTVYLAFSWLPSILSAAGLGPAVASTSLTAFNLGGVIGAVAGGALIPRVGSKRTMLTMTAGAIAGTAGLTLVPISPQAVLPVLVLLTITGGLINAVQTTMYALAANVYPSRVRATGVGTATAVGRSGAVLSGYAGPWALELGGSASFFALTAAALCVTFVALAMVARHIPRREPLQ